VDSNHYTKPARQKSRAQQEGPKLPSGEPSTNTLPRRNPKMQNRNRSGNLKPPKHQNQGNLKLPNHPSSNQEGLAESKRARTPQRQLPAREAAKAHPSTKDCGRRRANCKPCSGTTTSALRPPYNNSNPNSSRATSKMKPTRDTLMRSCQ
jgi:hypothetical protein